MRFTAEQQRVIDKVTAHLGEAESAIAGGRSFSVPAVAGAGKSAMIVEMARRDATQTAMFLCHSQNIADRARQNLPCNITVSTFQEAAEDFLSQIRPRKSREERVKRHTADELVRTMPTGTTRIEAERALDILARFYRSAHPTPQEVHLPSGESWTTLPGDRNAAIQTARMTWFAQMRLLSNMGKPDGQGGVGQPALPFSTSSLIKWWMLSHAETIYQRDSDTTKVIAPIPGNCGLIVVEEAQLLNVGLLDFLSRQRGSIVFFGDGYQSLVPGSAQLQHQHHPIYDRTETIPLHESWRFGPSVASVCSALANKAGESQTNYVQGLGHSAVYTSQQKATWERQAQHYAFIASRYETLFEEALAATYRGNVVAWLNGLENHPVRLLRDLVVLRDGVANASPAPGASRVIASPSLQHASTLDDVLQGCQRQPDALVARLARWVANQTEPYLLRVIDLWIRADQQRQTHYIERLDDPIQRDMTLGTVAQAQGHEWPRVALGDDLFPASLCDDNWHVQSHVTAIHFAYTAASRAQYGLAVPNAFLQHLRTHGWAMPPNSPDIELAEANAADARYGQHPIFGKDRCERLELTPETRQKIRRTKREEKVSSQHSGQNAVKRRMQEEARRNPAKGIAGLRAALKG